MRKILTAAFADFYLFPREYLLRLATALGTVMIGGLCWFAFAAGQMLSALPALKEVPPQPQETSSFLSSAPPLGIVDQGSFLSAERTPEFIFYPDETAALNAALDGDTGGYCVLPPDLPTALRIRCTYTDWQTALNAEKFPSLLKKRIRRASPLDARLEAALARMEIEEVPLDIPPPENKRLSLLEQLLPDGNMPASFLVAVTPLLIITAIFHRLDSALRNLAYSLIEEKRRRLMETLLASLSGTELLLAKLLSHTVFEAVLMTAVGLEILGQVWFGKQAGLADGGILALLTPELVFWTVAFVLGGYILYGLLFLGLAVRASHPNEIAPLQSLGTIIHAVALSGGTFILLGRALPWWYQVLSVFPLTSFLTMPYRLMVENPPLWQVLSAYLLLLVSIYPMARLAGHAAHPDVLLSNTPFKVRSWWRSRLRNRARRASSPADKAG